MVSPTSAWQFSHEDLLGLSSRQETSRTKGNISFCMFCYHSFIYLKIPFCRIRESVELPKRIRAMMYVVSRVLSFVPSLFQSVFTVCFETQEGVQSPPKCLFSAFFLTCCCLSLFLFICILHNSLLVTCGCLCWLFHSLKSKRRNVYSLRRQLQKTLRRFVSVVVFLFLYIFLFLSSLSHAFSLFQCMSFVVPRFFSFSLPFISIDNRVQGHEGELPFIAIRLSSGILIGPVGFGGPIDGALAYLKKKALRKQSEEKKALRKQSKVEAQFLPGLFIN